MRERVNYAVNERLNIYTRRGVGMTVAKRGSFGRPYVPRTRSIVEFGYGRRTPENSPPFPSRFKLIALERSRLCLNVGAAGKHPGAFWLPRNWYEIGVYARFVYAHKSDTGINMHMKRAWWYESGERWHGSRVDGVIDVWSDEENRWWPREHSFERVGALPRESISSSITITYRNKVETYVASFERHCKYFAIERGSLFLDDWNFNRIGSIHFESWETQHCFPRVRFFFFFFFFFSVEARRTIVKELTKQRKSGFSLFTAGPSISAALRWTSHRANCTEALISTINCRIVRHGIYRHACILVSLCRNTVFRCSIYNEPRDRLIISSYKNSSVKNCNLIYDSK